MNDRSSPTTLKIPSRGALKIALVYLILGIVWILFSDNLVAFLTHDPAERIQLGIIKGWVYVVLTAGLLYSLIRAETDKLQAGEKRFSKAVENLPDAFIFYDADRRVQYINPAAMQLGGGLLAGPTGRREEEIWPGTITRQSLPRLLEAFRSGEDQKFEISGTLPDGKPFSFKISYIPLQNGDGPVTGCYALIQDMTSVRQYELGLLESAERERVRAAEIETIMDAVPAFVWVTHDPKGRHISGNRATYALTRTQPGANLSKTGPADEILHHYTPYQKGKRIPPNELPVQHTAITGEPKRDYEFDLVFEDGETIHLAGNTAPLLDANGKPAGSVAAFIDISERNQMEMTLRKQEAQYRLLAENMADVIWVLDGATMRFTYVSPSVEKLRGYTPAEVMAQTLEQCMTPTSLAFITEMLPARIEAFLAGDPQAVTMTHEMEQICRDGSTVWTEVVTTLLQNSSGGLDILGVSRDITGRLQVLEALREREARLNAVINSTNAFVWSVDRAYRLTMANSEVIRDTLLVIGYELQVGENVFEGLPVEMHQAWKDRYDRVLQGESFHEEFIFSLPSGERTDREYTFNPIIDLEGRITGAACFGSDISERKRAEAALQESEQRFRQLANAMPLLIWTARPDGELDYINERKQEYSGLRLSAEGLYQWIQLVHTDDRETTLEKWRLSTQSGEMYQVEHRLMKTDGSHRWHLSRGVPVHGPNGQVEKWFGTSTDIEDNKQAEANLRENEEQLRLAHEAADLGTWWYDFEAGRYYFDDRARSHYGLDSNEMTITEVLAHIHPDDVARLSQAITSTTDSDSLGRFTTEYRVIHTDGSVHWMVMQAKLFFEGQGANRRPVKGVGTCQDITERKRADQELRSTAEELARSNAELEQFAYIASHDLKEPLRAVSGMVQLLQRNYEGKLDERADEYIKFAVEGSSRMQNLINDLLAFSRVGTQAKAFEPTQVELVLQFAKANLAAALRESGAVLTHDPLPSVTADPMQLTQVFQNLVANAIKFHGAEPPKIHIGAERAASEWRFSVHDHGIGIDPQYFERIFAVFQRLHTRREYPGTGIGLALCKKIVERHGGRIWVESQEGQGATFFFTIPDRRADNANEPRPHKV